MPSTTSLKLPEELKERIAELTQGVAQTPHAYMVEAIAEKVARDERHRDFLQSALDSMAAVNRTGVVYAAKDVHREFLARATGKRTQRKASPIKVATLKRQAK